MVRISDLAQYDKNVSKGCKSHKQQEQQQALFVKTKTQDCEGLCSLHDEKREKACLLSNCWNVCMVVFVMYVWLCVCCEVF